jgi:hypothetical protein
MRGSTGVVVVLFLWALAGCGEDDHYPPGEGGVPGGGGGGGAGGSDAGGGNDAGTADASLGDGGVQLTGTLCDVSDVRQPLACPSTPLSGIKVVDTATNRSATTASNGAFSLPIGFEESLVLAIGRGVDPTRDALVPATMWDGQGVRAPRVAQTVWDALMNDIGGNEGTGTATIAVYVVDDLEKLPVMGAEVITVASDAVFYDDESSLQGWSSTAAVTGPRGAALLLSVPVASTADFTVTVGGVVYPVTVPVEADELTWARVKVARP